jgi:tetratricopeptide (TPR) repeat protein
VCLFELACVRIAVVWSTTCLHRNLDGALEALLQAVELDPDHKVAMTNLAFVLLLLGQFEDSRTVYEGLMARFPSDDAILFAYSTYGRSELKADAPTSLVMGDTIFHLQSARMWRKAAMRLQ